MAGKGGHRWNPHGEQNPAWKGGVIADAEWFRQRYEVEGMSLRQVAKAAGRSVRTAARWAAKHGIKVRSPIEGKRANQKSGPEHPSWNPQIRRACRDCPTPLVRPLAGVEKRCPACLSRHWSMTRTGKGNPNYKGIGDISRTMRQHSDKTWRPRVYKRDNYRCQRCDDARGGNLRAHHIRRFGVLVDEALAGVILDTLGDRLAAIEALKEDEALNDIDNGVTLCLDCHDEIHRGKREDTVDWR